MLGDIRDRSRLTACAGVLGSVGPGLMLASADVTTVECDREELVKAAAFLAWIESSIQVRMAAAARSWTPLAVLATHRAPGIPRPEFPAPLRGVVSGMDRVRRMSVCAADAVGASESDTGIAICAALQQLSVWAHN